MITHHVVYYLPWLYLYLLPYGVIPLQINSIFYCIVAGSSFT